MDSPERGALTLVRLLGAMTVVMSFLELGLYLAKCYAPGHPVPVQPLAAALYLVPAALGVVVLIKARALAEWLSNFLDL
jgi:hypothetical protein